ncbi:MAG: hypothetical protein H7256_13400 [Bdellovibrio sp.]|nr:hypothetical protein [Bdellovibrio sp.]
MSPTKEIQIKLFGAFREFSADGTLVLTVTGQESAYEVKNLLTQKLSEKEKVKFDVKALVAKSVLATDSKVLDDADLAGHLNLSLLPPVCGG